MFRDFVNAVSLRWVYKATENSALASTYTEHTQGSSELMPYATMLAAVASGLHQSGLCLCQLQCCNIVLVAEQTETGQTQCLGQRLLFWLTWHRDRKQGTHAVMLRIGARIGSQAGCAHR